MLKYINNLIYLYYMWIGRPKFQADNTISLWENRAFKKQMREATRDDRAKIASYHEEAILKTIVY